MDREKSEHRRKPSIRLLVIAIWLCFYTSVNSLESYPIIKMEYSPKSPNLQELFKLKFTIQTKNNSQFKISSPSSLKLLLNDKNEFLKFEQSKIYYEKNNIVLEVQYKINKSGVLKLDNIFLIIGEHKILQPTIKLYIAPPELSSNTQFRIRLFDKNHNYIDHKNGNPLFLGEEYLVVIEGNFKYLKKQKIQVKYSLENKSLIEKNNGNMHWLNLNNGWYVISSFLWYSLNTGSVKLPEITINIVTEKEKYIFQLKNEIAKVIKLETDKNVLKNIEKEELRQRFVSSINPLIKSKKELSKRLEIAGNIKALREKESKSFFYWQIKAEREKLERELGLEHVFPVFNYPIFFALLLFSVILIFILMLLLLIKKIKFNFPTVLILFFELAMTLYIILLADFRKEYTLQDEKNDNNIYLNPEAHSSKVDSIELGETVKISYTINGYKYIEKYNNSNGWIK